MKERLYIIVPAYNERENIRALVEDWYPIVEDLEGDRENSRLVVVNDGSTDDTLDILETLKEGRPLLEVLTKPCGTHGDTVLYGYRYAAAQGADWIFQTDADGQTRAEEFPAFWALREQADAVIGFRKKRGDGAGRMFVEKVLCRMLRLYFGVRVPDANAPFRLMRTEKVAEYIRRMPEQYFLPNVMLTVFFVRFGDRVEFREITFENRKGGTGTINLKKIVKVGFQSLRDFRTFRRELKKAAVSDKRSPALR